MNYRAAFILLIFFGLSSTVLAGEKLPLSSFKPDLGADFKTLLKNASQENGEEFFMRKCSACHDHQKTGGHSKGPFLWNWFGRKAGSLEGFEYSPAMKDSGHSWDLATLNYYLARTDVAVPGRIMNFRGIKSDESRADLIRFLLTLNDNPPSIPD